MYFYFPNQSIQTSFDSSDSALRLTNRSSTRAQSFDVVLQFVYITKFKRNLRQAKSLLVSLSFRLKFPLFRRLGKNCK